VTVKTVVRFFGLL